LQNLKRGSFLRKSIKAPSGYSLVVCDLSQIEPRVLAHIADHQGLLDIFSSGQDAYSAFGAQMFGIPGLNKKDHPDLRQSAKSALLGCGYGMGWASFAAQLLTGFLGAPPTMYDKAFASTLHVTKMDANDFAENQDYMKKLEDIPHTCTTEELFIHALCAKKIIGKYREASQPVVEFWNLCGQLIEYSLSKGKPYEYKCLTFDKERIILPSGLWLRYPNLEFRPYAEGEKPSWCYQDGKKTKRLYGGKLVENIVQAVARCVMTDGMLRIQKRYPCVLTVHDEVVVLVPDAEVQEAEKWVYDQMVMNPSYLDGIPLDAEASTAKRYGDAK
jgi:DNA polymerase